VGDHAPRGMTITRQLDRTRLTGRQYPLSPFAVVSYVLK
jgi:hypothetical protein